MVSAFFYIPCTFLGTWLYSQNMHVGPSLQEFSRESRRWLKPNFKTNQNTAHTHTHTKPFHLFLISFLPSSSLLITIYFSIFLSNKSRFVSALFPITSLQTAMGSEAEVRLPSCAQDSYHCFFWNQMWFVRFERRSWRPGLMFSELGFPRSFINFLSFGFALSWPSLSRISWVIP